MKKRTVDIVVSCALILLSGLGLLQARSFPGSAARIPNFVFIALIVLSLYQLVTLLIKKDDEVVEFGIKRLLTIMGLTIGLIILTLLCGFYVGAGVFILSTMLLFGVKNKWVLVLVPVIFLLFVYFVFDKVLGIRPPTGILF